MKVVRLKQSTQGEEAPVLEPQNITTILILPIVTAAACITCLMMPGGRGNDATHRQPPFWDPETSRESFRSWMTNITLWVMLTDLQPHQQVAAIILRLGGSAREMARQITPQEMMNGGMAKEWRRIQSPISSTRSSASTRSWTRRHEWQA